MGEMLLNGIPYGTNGIRELTQSQYDALPASKLTDGILYCIKDEGIVEGDQYAPVIYSLAEREIGVWTDGKPLYERTIEITTISSGSEKSFAHGISDIDIVIGCKGIAYNANDHKSFITFIVPSDVTSNTSSISGRYVFTISNVDKTNIVCAIGSGIVSQLSKLIFTIQYTKTTDVPGSGSWGTDGVPMVHYDGNEKIIGTWFGQTLYEKTMQLSLTPGSNTTAIPHGITGIAKVVDYEGTLFDSMYGTDKTCKMSMSVFNSATSGGMTANSMYCANLQYVDATNVMYSLGSSYHSNAPLYLTVRYTKSS